MPYMLFIAGSIVAFIYGTVVGSFLNVCIYRLPRGESLVTPPSHCPTCNTRLQPADLIPLFSFLFLGTKCRYCKTGISWRYFTIEFITGILFVVAWLSLAMRLPFLNVTLWSAQGWLLVILLWVWCATMLVTFMIDLDTTYVIEPVTWMGMGAGVLFELIRYWGHWQDMGVYFGSRFISYVPAALPGMFVGFMVFILMDWFGRLVFRKPGMGLGDAFIGAAIGAMLGTRLALLSFGIAILFGALVGIVLIIAGLLTPKPAPGSEEKAVSDGPMEEVEEEPQGRYMPFGPFLTASAMLVAMAPEHIWVATRILWDTWIYHNPFM